LRRQRTSDMGPEEPGRSGYENGPHRKTT
jgi:hypothetical protein